MRTRFRGQKTTIACLGLLPRSKSGKCDNLNRSKKRKPDAVSYSQRKSQRVIGQAKPTSGGGDSIQKNDGALKNEKSIGLLRSEKTRALADRAGISGRGRRATKSNLCSGSRSTSEDSDRTVSLNLSPEKRKYGLRCKITSFAEDDGKDPANHKSDNSGSALIAKVSEDSQPSTDGSSSKIKALACSLGTTPYAAPKSAVPPVVQLPMSAHNGCELANGFLSFPYMADNIKKPNYLPMKNISSRPADAHTRRTLDIDHGMWVFDCPIESSVDVIDLNYEFSRDKCITTSRFGTTDEVLQEILAELNLTGKVPTPTKRCLSNTHNLYTSDDNMEIQYENSLINLTTEQLWCNGDINRELGCKDEFLASAGLLRPSVCEVWRKRREDKTKQLSRSVMGRLRPNPRPRRYSDMISPHATNPSSLLVTRTKCYYRNDSLRTHGVSAARLTAAKKLSLAKSLQQSNTSVGLEFIADTSFDPSADVKSNPQLSSFDVARRDRTINVRIKASSSRSSSPVDYPANGIRSRTRRRPDIRHHIDWKFCYAEQSRQSNSGSVASTNVKSDGFKKRQILNMSSSLGEKPRTVAIARTLAVQSKLDKRKVVRRRDGAGNSADEVEKVDSQLSIESGDNSKPDAEENDVCPKVSRSHLIISPKKVHSVSSPNKRMTVSLDITRRHGLSVKRKRLQATESILSLSSDQSDDSHSINDENESVIHADQTARHKACGNLEKRWRAATYRQRNLGVRQRICPTNELSRDNSSVASSSSAASQHAEICDVYGRSFRQTPWYGKPTSHSNLTSNYSHKTDLRSKHNPESARMTHLRTCTPPRRALVRSHKSLRHRNERMRQLTLLDRLVLGLNCSVSQGDDEIHIKQLHAEDLNILTQRINRTGFLITSLALRTTANNDAEYNIVLTYSPKMEAEAKRAARKLRSLGTIGSSRFASNDLSLNFGNEPGDDGDGEDDEYGLDVDFELDKEVGELHCKTSKQHSFSSGNKHNKFREDESDIAKPGKDPSLGVRSSLSMLEQFHKGCLSRPVRSLVNCSTSLENTGYASDTISEIISRQEIFLTEFNKKPSFSDDSNFDRDENCHLRPFSSVLFKNNRSKGALSQWLFSTHNSSSIHKPRSVHNCDSDNSDDADTLAPIYHSMSSGQQAELTRSRTIRNPFNKVKKSVSSAFMLFLQEKQIRGVTPRQLPGGTTAKRPRNSDIGDSGEDIQVGNISPHTTPMPIACGGALSAPNQLHVNRKNLCDNEMLGAGFVPATQTIQLSASSFRRHSPRKLIRKVYTGSSTIPKILNRKRPGPSITSSQSQQPSSNSSGPSVSLVHHVTAPSMQPSALPPPAPASTPLINVSLTSGISNSSGSTVFLSGPVAPSITESSTSAQHQTSITSSPTIVNVSARPQNSGSATAQIVVTQVAAPTSSHSSMNQVSSVPASSASTLQNMDPNGDVKTKPLPVVTTSRSISSSSSINVVPSKTISLVTTPSVVAATCNNLLSTPDIQFPPGSIFADLKSLSNLDDSHTPANSMSASQLLRMKRAPSHSLGSSSQAGCCGRLPCQHPQGQAVTQSGFSSGHQTLPHSTQGQQPSGQVMTNKGGSNAAKFHLTFTTPSTCHMKSAPLESPASNSCSLHQMQHQTLGKPVPLHKWLDCSGEKGETEPSHLDYHKSNDSSSLLDEESRAKCLLNQAVAEEPHHTETGALIPGNGGVPGTTIVKVRHTPNPRATYQIPPNVVESCPGNLPNMEKHTKTDIDDDDYDDFELKTVHNKSSYPLHSSVNDPVISSVACHVNNQTNTASSNSNVEVYSVKRQHQLVSGQPTKVVSIEPLSKPRYITAVGSSMTTLRQEKSTNDMLLLSAQASVHQSSNSSDMSSSSIVNTKRTVVHKLHSFRKILPKSPDRSSSVHAPNSGPAILPSALASSPSSCLSNPLLTGTATVRVSTGSFIPLQPPIQQQGPLLHGQVNSTIRRISQSNITPSINREAHPQLLKTLLEEGDARSITPAQPQHHSLGLSGPLRNQPAYQSRGMWQTTKRAVPASPAVLANRAAAAAAARTFQSVGLPLNAQHSQSGVSVLRVDALRNSVPRIQLNSLGSTVIRPHVPDVGPAETISEDGVPQAVCHVCLDLS